MICLKCKLRDAICTYLHYYAGDQQEAAEAWDSAFYALSETGWHDSMHRRSAWLLFKPKSAMEKAVIFLVFKE